LGPARATEPGLRGAEELEAVLRVVADLPLYRVLGVRHEAYDVSALAAHAGDVADGAVRARLGSHAAGAVDVAKDDAALALERRERVLVGHPAALAVLDREREELARMAGPGEGRLDGLHANGDEIADEAERSVPHQRTGQKPRLAQHLEAVADAEHEAAVSGVAADGVHDRRAARHGAAAEVVAVGEAAGQQHDVGAAQ